MIQLVCAIAADHNHYHKHFLDDYHLPRPDLITQLFFTIRGEFDVEEEDRFNTCSAWNRNIGNGRS